MKLFTRIPLIFLFSIILLAPVWASVKPPQFVVISFDNCTELKRWELLSDFLQEMKRSGHPVHFTFFVSGTNFLTQINKNLYHGPHHAVGETEIDFGGNQQEVEKRIQFINDLYRDGNEFASHAVGHFDGSKWKVEDWLNEFNQYQQLINNVTHNNHLSNDTKLAYSAQEIIGFRAPYLGRSAALYQALLYHHFRYDASGISAANEWPTKKNGLWHFNLARIKIAQTNKYTLSMDYNLMVDLPLKKYDRVLKEKYKKQIQDTYLNYFMKSYHGNRAPVIIGHHFKNFQDGIYNEALLQFAYQVCRLPDVQCVTFAKLADYLDQHDH